MRSGVVAPFDHTKSKDWGGVAVRSILPLLSPQVAGVASVVNSGPLLSSMVILAEAVQPPSSVTVTV
jgi:hypothetical protein